MPGSITTALGRTAERVPGLRRVPVVRLLAIAEIAGLARDHLTKLEPDERRRVLELIRIGRGRTGNLSKRQRRELADLIAKAEPRLFAGVALNKLSPVSLPDRLVHGSPASKKK
jgi:hypothetical protein